MNEKIEQTASESVENTKSEISKGVTDRYEKPILVCYGDVRDITLGPSPGFGESGAGVFFLQP